MPSLFVLALSVTLGVSPGLRTVDLPPPPMVDFPAQAPPAIDAAAWMVWSVEGDAELGARDPDTPRSPASITKLMTALLTMEKAAPTDLVTISANADATPIGFAGQPDIRQGEVWSVRDLLKNLLVQSGNDAAVALAEQVAGSVDAFVAMMNAKAVELGMTHTTFKNPNGLDTTGHEMSARDIVIMGRAALAHPDLLRIARIKHVTFDVGGRLIEADATDRDLGVFPGLFGLKTGDTASAGQTMLAYAVTQRGSVLSVVLGTANRKEATRALLAWAWTALGPKDYFFAPVLGTDLALTFPDWYLTRIAAAGDLATGDPTVPVSTPLTDAIDTGLSNLLPALLGGSSP